MNHQDFIYKSHPIYSSQEIWQQRTNNSHFAVFN